MLDQNKGWSDYRIGFSKEIDLDILPHQVSLDTYSATLGHKVRQRTPTALLANHHLLVTAELSLFQLQRSLRAALAPEVREDHECGGQL